MSDRAIGLLVVAISVFSYVQTFYFGQPPFAAFQGMGAEFFPRGILIALAALGSALLVRGRGSLLPRVDLGSVRSRLRQYREVIISLALFPVYVAGIELVGFLLSTMAYLVVMQLVLYPRKGLGLIYVVAGSVAFTWAVVEVFQRYLSVVLPRGSLF